MLSNLPDDAYGTLLKADILIGTKLNEHHKSRAMKRIGEVQFDPFNRFSSFMKKHRIEKNHSHWQCIRFVSLRRSVFEKTDTGEGGWVKLEARPEAPSACPVSKAFAVFLPFSTQSLFLDASPGSYFQSSHQAPARQRHPHRSLDAAPQQTQ